MADSLCCNIDILSDLDQCGVGDMVDVIVPALESLYDQCCFGTTTSDPLAMPSTVTSEAFPDGIGTLNCSCPIIYVVDSNGDLYYSLDNGLTYIALSPQQPCQFSLESVTGSIDINDVDVSSEQGYIDAVAAGCNVIFAVAANGRSYAISPLLNAGDGVSDTGEWCDICEGVGGIPFEPFSETFEYSGSDYYIQAPEGATKITVKIWGAGGAQACYNSCTQVNENAAGGGGGYVQASYDLEEDEEEFTVHVGQGGGQYEDGIDPRAYYGGAVGLDNGGINYMQCGGGGDWSGVWRTHVSIDSSNHDTDSLLLAIAGGGGGGLSLEDNGSVCHTVPTPVQTQQSIWSIIDGAHSSDSGTQQQAGGGSSPTNNLPYDSYDTCDTIEYRPALGGANIVGDGGAFFSTYDTDDQAPIDELPANSLDGDRINNAGEGGCDSCGTGLTSSYGFQSNGGHGLVVVVWE